MNVKHMVFLVVLEVWCSLVLIHTYTIERRVVYQSRTWSDMPDSFIIPSSICSSGRRAQSTQCSEMGAIYDNNCKCICETSKSTFGFYEDKWKCFENTKVHLHGGSCSIELDYRHTSGVLRVLPMRRPKDYYILSLPDTDCGLNDYSYLMCDGTWGHLDANLFSSRFNINHFSGSHLLWYLQYSTGLLSTSAINGRLFRLQFECGPVHQPTTHCGLFKVTGTLKCPAPSPTPSSSIMFSTRRVSTSTVTITSSSSSAPASSIFPSPSSTPRLKTSVPLPTPSLSSNKFEYSFKSTTIPRIDHTLAATATEKPTSRNDAKTNIFETTTAVVDRREKNDNGSDHDDNSGVIAGALAGVSGLVIIVVAMIVVTRRRKRRDTEPKSTVIAENEGYGRGVDNSLRFNDRSQESPDEDEYSYAYNNAAPFVKTLKQDMESRTNTNHEPGSSVVNRIYDQTDELNQMACEAPVYNTLEEAVYAKVDKSKKEYPSNSADAPVYNTLEEPEYAKVDKSLKAKLSAENQEEPVYNILDGPETDEGLSDEPPSYQVLEGPFSEGAPVYDVLEGPESDEDPVYGTLEGQDPHIHGALDMPDNQGPPKDNRGYDDIVYDSVGDVINDQGDIYQELNRNAQRNSDVYQALNYPGNTMHLNELNQTHSNA